MLVVSYNHVNSADPLAKRSRARDSIDSVEPFDLSGPSHGTRQIQGSRRSPSETERLEKQMSELRDQSTSIINATHDFNDREQAKKDVEISRLKAENLRLQLEAIEASRLRQRIAAIEKNAAASQEAMDTLIAGLMNENDRLSREPSMRIR